MSLAALVSEVSCTAMAQQLNTLSIPSNHVIGMHTISEGELKTQSRPDIC